VIHGPGVASHLVCEILPDKCISNLGDHSIIVAKVISGPSYAYRAPPQDEYFKNGFPPLLMYSEGHFKEHGSPIDVSHDLDISTENNEVVPQRASSHHPDRKLQRNLINAGEPALYQAATSYMDSVLFKYKHSEKHLVMKQIYGLFDGAVDRRAKFVAALKFWQFQRCLQRNEDVETLGLQILANSGANFMQTVLQDHRLMEVAQELVKSSQLDTMGSDAMGWLKPVYKDLNKKIGAQKGTNAGTRARGRSIDLKPDAGGSQPAHSDGAEDPGIDVRLDNVLQKANATLKKYELAQPTGDDEQKGQAEDQKPSY
jgi:hypothetical protein